MMVRHEAYHFSGGLNVYKASLANKTFNLLEEVGAYTFQHNNMFFGAMSAVVAGHANYLIPSALFFTGSTAFGAYLWQKQ